MRGGRDIYSLAWATALDGCISGVQSTASGYHTAWWDRWMDIMGGAYNIKVHDGGVEIGLLRDNVYKSAMSHECNGSSSTRLPSKLVISKDV